MFSKDMASISCAPCENSEGLAIRADISAPCVSAPRRKSSCAGKPFWCSQWTSLEVCGRLIYSGILLPKVFVRVAGVAL